jgi:membrane-associated phospholipid phosphatase
MIRTSRLLVSTAAILLAAGLAAPASASNVIQEWNELALSTVKDSRTGPPPTTRMLAMMHTAMYNAVNGVGQSANSQYGAAPTIAGGVNREIAAAKAARDILATAYPDRAAIFDAKLAATTARFAGDSTVGASLNFGAAQANHIIAMRANDGFGAAYSYVPSTGMGTYGNYQFTGPNQTTAKFQEFAAMTPWTMSSVSQFRPGPPPTLTSQQYAEEYAQVKALGGINSIVRTAEQTQIARFWAAGPGTVTPPGMWNQIASGIAADRNLTLEASAQLFAKLNMGLADAAIGAWDAKAIYDNWRPVTGIRMGDLDGNPLTLGDPNWTSLINAPEFQAYVSGHSTFSATGATILAQFFGTDQMCFEVTDEAGNVRSFASIWAAAQEAGMSRIYGGIHWMSDNTAALTLGQAIAMNLFNQQFIPTPSAAAVIALAGLAATRRRRAC